VRLGGGDRLVQGFPSQAGAPGTTGQLGQRAEGFQWMVARQGGLSLQHGLEGFCRFVSNTKGLPGHDVNHQIGSSNANRAAIGSMADRCNRFTVFGELYCHFYNIATQGIDGISPAIMGLKPTLMAGVFGPLQDYLAVSISLTISDHNVPFVFALPAKAAGQSIQPIECKPVKSGLCMTKLT